MLTVLIRMESTFFCSKSIFGLPPGNPLEATLHMTEENLLAPVDRQFFFPTSRQRLAETALPLQTWLLNDANTLSKGSTQPST